MYAASEYNLFQNQDTSNPRKIGQKYWNVVNGNHAEHEFKNTLLITRRLVNKYFEDADIDTPQLAMFNNAMELLLSIEDPDHIYYGENIKYFTPIIYIINRRDPQIDVQYKIIDGNGHNTEEYLVNLDRNSFEVMSFYDTPLKLVNP